jgi:hypothetical protein
MRKFIKYFFPAMIIQAVIIALVLLLRSGELILLPYWLPYAFLPLFIDSPARGSESAAHPIILFSIPAVFYSIIFALIMCVIKREEKLT